MKQIYPMAESAKVKCPTCGGETEFFSEPVGPFCSRRCQMIDLGKWLGEEYRISEPLSPDHLEDYEQIEGEQLDQPET